MSKRGFVLGLVLGSLLFSFGTGMGEEGSPQIQFEEREFNWGTIYDGEKMNHIFTFTNTGDAELVIESVNSSCGCTAVLVSEKVIPPGGKGEIKASFDSTRRTGTQTKTITVKSNDPKEPSITLMITGLVEQYIQVKPDLLNMGTVFRGEKATQTLRIIPPKIRQNLRIKKVESNQNYLLTELGTGENWGKQLTSRILSLFKKKGPEVKEEVGIPITVTLTQEAPIGNIRGSIKIETDDERRPTLDVRVVGTVSGPILVTPQAITFSRAVGAERESQKVTITSREVGFEILDVENKSPNLSVETIEKEKGKSYEIEVKLSSDAPKGQFRENLVIHTNNKDQSVINIPVFGIVQ